MTLQQTAFYPTGGGQPNDTGTLQGRIVSGWKREAGRFELDLTVPANTTATVYLPARDAVSLMEGGTELERARGVKFLRLEGDRAVLAVESGSYRFAAKTSL